MRNRVGLRRVVGRGDFAPSRPIFLPVRLPFENRHFGVDNTVAVGPRAWAAAMDRSKNRSLTVALGGRGGLHGGRRTTRWRLWLVQKGPHSGPYGRGDGSVLEARRIAVRICILCSKSSAFAVLGRTS